MPGAFFKSLGLGAVCHALGGVLAGIVTVNEGGPAWPAVNQGAFILAIDVSRFAPVDTFKTQMDDFVEGVRRLRPFPGHDRADLPGALEWEREREWAAEGIPIGREHRDRLEAGASEFGVPTPF
jgi:LDH2 family malate/lactate/ureidoglycolate dehydrogenase